MLDEKYLSPEVKIIRVNAESREYTPEGWYKSATGIEIVFNEYVKMRTQQITGAA